MHDNEDGTFSERCFTRPRSTGSAIRQPAVVISRGPADPSDPAALPASYPGAVPISDHTPDISPFKATELGNDTDQSTPARDEELGPGGDVDALWSYVQPYLTKHQGTHIPAQGWVRQLLTLPRVRDLDWNMPWISAHPFSDTNPRDISALLLQVTGEPAPYRCEKCVTGRGPFTSCVMISSEAPNGPLANIFSCANCFYHSGQTYCNLKHWGAQRAGPILESRRERDPLDDLVDEMAAEDNDDEGSVESEEGDTNANDDEIMDHSISETPPILRHIPADILEAEPGRPYTMWPGEGGARVVSG